MNKRGQWERTSEGLTDTMRRAKDHTSKRLRCQLNSNANFIRFDWVEFMSTEYFVTIESKLATLFHYRTTFLLDC